MHKVAGKFSDEESYETGLFQWHIWKAEWIKYSALRQTQTSSSTGRQDQCIHSKTSDVEKLDIAGELMEQMLFALRFWVSMTAVVWERQMFNTAARLDFTCAEQDQFIEMTSDWGLRPKHAPFKSWILTKSLCFCSSFFVLYCCSSGKSDQHTYCYCWPKSLKPWLNYEACSVKSGADIVHHRKAFFP